MIFNSSNIITASLTAVLTLFSGAVANAQKPMSPDRSTVQVQDTAKVPLLSPNYDDETEHTPLRCHLKPPPSPDMENIQ